MNRHTKRTIIRRQIDPQHHLFSSDLHPLLRRVYAARSVDSIQALSYTLNDLLPYTLLKNVEESAKHLAEAIRFQQRILIVGDFDADGATSTALAVSALRAFGAQHVSYLVPNRFEYGYGLTPEIVQVAARWKPDWIITVDNGIASHDGVIAANNLGIKVLITDHHLPAKTLPEAVVIVNPNQPHDEFPCKNMAGVGVIFYVMLALRAALRANNWFTEKNIEPPNMAQFLDLVALGTVADVVALDHHNRVMVQQGLKRIRAMQCRPGIQALLKLSNRRIEQLSASDLGFVIAPRLNAAGRLTDMSLGIECLLTEDKHKAHEMAQQLDALNQERRGIEAEMQQQALQALNFLSLEKQAEQMPLGLCLYHENWHQGVVGILASRIKERFLRPVIAFAKVSEEELKGSARSIEGLHIRDVLDNIATQHPGLITKFGGHAMAAGLSLPKAHYEKFSDAFIAEVSKYISVKNLSDKIFSDGELTAAEFTVECASLLSEASPWGQAFPVPLFDGIFTIIEQRLVANKHLKLLLRPTHESIVVEAIAFNVNNEIWPNHRCERMHAVYHLDVNTYRDRSNVQLIINYFEPC